MRYLIAALTFTVFTFFTCKKESDKNACLADMVITKATAVNTSGIQYGILLNLEAYGPNLCYT